MLKHSLLTLLLAPSFASAAEESDSAGEPASPFGGYEQILLLVAFVGIFYFLIIRPQSKRSKQHKQLINSVAAGDEIVTSSGIMGKVTKMKDDVLDVEIAKGTVIQLKKQYVSAVLPKQTIEARK